ncbi:hypothetical protein BGW41_008371 [Actinomortierella wolfii]|nr:hypothetical protein BGW41_008371 [Actinomortierella wolfii]
MYQRHIAYDNFKSFFSKLKIKKYSFDISVNKVLLLMHDVSKLENNEFAPDILNLLTGQAAVSISLVKEVSAANEELEEFEKERADFNSGFLLGAAVMGAFGTALDATFLFLLL